ncbi:MAG: 7-carboxy-7-deazaguanine synthase QueE [Pseudomonadota bacterium]
MAAAAPVQAPAKRVKITEIFRSIQGEAHAAGWPTTFIRLTGCPLRCTWCDTAYAFHGGRWWTFDDVLAEVEGLGVKHVCVTGGEPLAQKRCFDLLTGLCDAGYAVSLETSGALDVSAVDPRVRRVVDLKAPASGESGRNRWENLEVLRPEEEVKFVIADRDDFDWALARVQEHSIAERVTVLFSPVWESLPPAELAAWILDAGAPVRLQVQLHKVLWGEEPGR